MLDNKNYLEGPDDPSSLQPLENLPETRESGKVSQLPLPGQVKKALLAASAFALLLTPNAESAESSTSTTLDETMFGLHAEALQGILEQPVQETTTRAETDQKEGEGEESAVQSPVQELLKDKSTVGGITAVLVAGVFFALAQMWEDMKKRRKEQRNPSSKLTPAQKQANRKKYFEDMHKEKEEAHSS